MTLAITGGADVQVGLLQLVQSNALLLQLVQSHALLQPSQVN
jgi:hypothetical protein